MLSRERLRVTGSEPVGPSPCSGSSEGRLDPGIPGQFFMLEAPGRVLPRPMSLCLAPPGELAFLFEPIGPGTRALAALEPGDDLAVLGPLGNGFRLDVERPLLVGGGIGIAPLPYLSEALNTPPAVIGFRSSSTWRRRPAASGRSSRRSHARHRRAPVGVRRPRLRAGADARSGGRACPGCSARMGSADGLRLRRVLRLRRRGRRRLQAALRGGPRPCCLTRQAASTR